MRCRQYEIFYDLLAIYIISSTSAGWLIKLNRLPMAWGPSIAHAWFRESLLLFVTSHPVCLQEGSVGCTGAHISVPTVAAGLLFLHALPPTTTRVCRPQPPRAGRPGESAALQEVPHQLRDRGNGSTTSSALDCIARHVSKSRNLFLSTYCNLGAKHRGGQRVQRRPGHRAVEVVCRAESRQPPGFAGFRQFLRPGGQRSLVGKISQVCLLSVRLFRGVVQSFGRSTSFASSNCAIACQKDHFNTSHEALQVQLLLGWCKSVAGCRASDAFLAGVNIFRKVPFPVKHGCVPFIIFVTVEFVSNRSSVSMDG